MYKRLDGWDGRFILLTGVLFLAITTLPYVYGYLSTPPDKVFMGLVGRDVAGTYMHFSWAVQSEEGNHLFVNRLTPEEHKPFYFHPEWWLHGKVLRYSGLPVLLGFQVERCLTVLFVIASLYYFVACFFRTAFERRCVLILVLFAPGLGWVFWLMRHYAGADFGLWLWDIEGIDLFGFMMQKPHYARSLAFVCLAYAFLLKGEEKDQRAYFFLAGLCVVIHGFIRPYNLPVAFLLFILFPLFISIREGGITGRRAGNYLTLIATSSLILLYYIYLYSFTILGEAFGQVSLRPLTPLELAIWLGLPLVAALFGFDGFKEMRHKENSQIFLCLWGAALVVLIYSFPLIRWGMEGAGPLCIFAPILAGKTIFNQAVPGLVRTRAGMRMTRKGISIALIALIVLFSFPSNLVLLGQTVKKLSNHSRPYYLHESLVDAFAWLRQNARPDEVVTPPVSAFMPPRI